MGSVEAFAERRKLVECNFLKASTKNILRLVRKDLHTFGFSRSCSIILMVPGGVARVGELSVCHDSIKPPVRSCRFIAKFV